MKQFIKTEIIIRASREKVWNILTNFSEYPQWNPFIIAVEGNLQTGNRLKNTLLSNGKKMQFRPVILDVTPGKSFSWLGSLFIKGIFDGKHYFIIESIDETQVKLIHGEEFSGILSSYILKKIGDDTRKNFIAMNIALKQLAESKM